MSPGWNGVRAANNTELSFVIQTITSHERSGRRDEILKTLCSPDTYCEICDQAWPIIYTTFMETFARHSDIFVGMRVDLDEHLTKSGKAVMQLLNNNFDKFIRRIVHIFSRIKGL